MKRRACIVALSLALAACATARRPTMDSSHGTGTPAAGTPAVPAPRALIVGRATAMLGQPYRWGGDEPGGFDCSGLVVYATRNSGLHVPRTAAEQERTGVAVARRELRAGDLVFMHLSHKELHVGIALDGDRFVHAPSTGGHVRIDSLNAAPYARAFLKARRIITD